MSSTAQQLRKAKKQPPRSPLRVVGRSRKNLVKRGKQRRVAPMLVLATILVIATIFAVLLEQVVLAQTGFKMAQLRDELVEAEAKQAELVLQAAKLSSSERIERYAITDLGMVRAERVEYIVADVRTTTDQRLAEDSRASQLANPSSGVDLGASAP